MIILPGDIAVLVRVGADLIYFSTSDVMEPRLTNWLINW